MTVSRGLRLSALLAGALFAILSTSALAGDSLVRVITTAPPNLPESIAFDHSGTTYLSMPFANKVVKFAPGGELTTVATFPSMFPLGVRLDDEGNVFIAVVGSGIWKVPAEGGATEQVASGPGLWNGLAFDLRGNLYVAANSKGQIDRVDRRGRIQVLASGDPLSFPSDIAFGTERSDRKDIFISNFAAFPTSAGAPGVLEMEVGIPGKPDD